uniref:Uncharacterized protein n=1 Tax=Ascaris lumbricoides TaxID=6252 RepID=A0A0M3HP10_ASCLU
MCQRVRWISEFNSDTIPAIISRTGFFLACLSHHLNPNVGSQRSQYLSSNGPSAIQNWFRPKLVPCPRNAFLGP